MPTPLRKEIRSGKVLKSRPQMVEDGEAAEEVQLQQTPEPVEEADSKQLVVAMPEFADNAVSSRQSLPAGAGANEKLSRSQRTRRDTAAAKLAQPTDDQTAASTEEEETLQPTQEPVDQVEAGERPTPTAPFLPSTGRPSTRRSLPAVNTGVRNSRRGGRQTTHAAFSSMSDEAASPSSPPADATIAMDGVPPTPASPHKSSAKRQSLRSHVPATEEEQEEQQEASEQFAAPAFVPVSRQVASRQSVPASKRAENTRAASRQSAAPSVQYKQQSSDDMEVDEPAETSEEQPQEADEEAHTPNEPTDFQTAAPPARHSMPVPTNTASSSSSTRRQSSAPAFQYVDAPTTQPLALPSPVRRSIEQRLPRQPVTVQQPLTSPLARDIKRGRQLRPANTQAAAHEQPTSIVDNAAEVSEASSSSADVQEEEVKAVAEQLDASTAESVAQPAQPVKRGGRKRKVDVAAGPAAAAEEQPQSAAPAKLSTRSKRRKPAANEESVEEPDAVPPPAPTPSASASSTASSRTRKGKKAVQIADDTYVEQQIESADATMSEEVREEEALPAPTRGRKGKQSRMHVPPAAPQPEPVQVEDDAVQPASASTARRGRRAQQDDNAMVDSAEEAAATEQQAAASTSTLRAAPTRSRRGRKEETVSDEHVAEQPPQRPVRRARKGAEDVEQPSEEREEHTTDEPGVQPEVPSTRSRATRSRAAVSDSEPTEVSVPAATRKSRRTKADTEETPATESIAAPAIAQSTTSVRRARTRKIAQAAATEDEPAVLTARPTRGSRRGAAAVATESAEQAEDGDEHVPPMSVAPNATRTRKGRRGQQTELGAAAGNDTTEEQKEESGAGESQEQSTAPVRRGRRAVTSALPVDESADVVALPSKRASKRKQTVAAAAADEQQQPPAVEAALSTAEPAKRTRRTKAAAPEQVSNESNGAVKSGVRVTRSRAGRS